MKLHNIVITIATAGAIGTFSSCVDQIKFGNAFLEKAPGADVTQDTIFNNGDYARRFLWNTYSKLYYGIPYWWDGGTAVKMNTGCFEMLSDTWHSHNSWDEVVTKYYSGAYIPGDDGKWSYTGESVWDAVRSAYIFLENIDRTPDKSKDPKNGIAADEKERLKAEAKCIIASRYFDVFRQYGGLPLVKSADYNGMEASYEIPRATVAETVKFMVDLLDEAAPHLPWNLPDKGDENLSTWDGRFTKAAAMAIKCKILLFAASPLFNDSKPYCTTGSQEANEKKQTWYGDYQESRWQDCVKACKELLDAIEANGYYKLVEATDKTPGGYRAAFRKAYTKRGNTEILFSTRVRYAPSEDEFHYQWFDWNGYGDYVPTEDYVEMFPWKDGTPFDYSKLEKEGKLDEMFMNTDWTLNRDPRLYETIIVNNVQQSLNEETGKMGGRREELWVNGRDVGSSGSSNESGQFASGFGNNKFYFTSHDDYYNKPLLWPYVRLSEIYLIYAEALTRTGQYDEAIKWIDKVRARVGLKGLKESQPDKDFHNEQTLIDAILQERACELGFEDTRFFDLIRNKRADLFEKHPHGLRMYRQAWDSKEGKYVDYNVSWSDKEDASDINKAPFHFRYEKFELQQFPAFWWGAGNFNPKWYLSAFPEAEVNKGYGLTQNPGW